MRELVHKRVRGTLPIHADLEVGEGVTPVRVAAVLADQELRPECRSSGGTTACSARSQPASPVPAGSATLTA